MIKIIANKKVELIPDEYNYYLELEKIFGKEAFIDLFNVNERAQITFVAPSLNQPTSMVLVFFFMNVMFNQRLRQFDEKISKLEMKINNEQ